MNLVFNYLPVNDINEALALYRDALGFEVAWREGDATAGLMLPGTEVQLMLDQDAQPGDKPGPFFQVDDVDQFYAANKDKLSFNFSPTDIPPGRYVSFDDPSGNRIHVLDLRYSGEAE